MSIQNRKFGSRQGKIGKGSEAAHGLLTTREKRSSVKKKSDRTALLFFILKALGSFGILSFYQVPALSVSKIYTAFAAFEFNEIFREIKSQPSDCPIRYPYKKGNKLTRIVLVGRRESSLRYFLVNPLRVSAHCKAVVRYWTFPWSDLPVHIGSAPA
jgi:hypothetical protein